MKTLSLFLLFSLSVNTYAARTATVKMVRGKATKLLPGSFKATKIKKGDLIPEDTSIVTKNRSFVRIVFKDKTSMSIGAKSKVIVSKIPPRKANMVKLLTGIIKAKVDKGTKKKTDTKLLIKTRTAVMGVRGTKFQSTYNPANKTTSLVTVEGKVAMVKVEEKIVQAAEPVAESGIESAPSKAARVVITDDVDKLDKLLETSEKTVEVPAGRYSGVVENVAKPTVPVKIAPKQYNAIAKSMGSKKKAKEVMKTTKADAPAEGFENKATGELAPKAGGIVDFSTGIYVAPTAAAVLDKKTGTFEDKSIGRVNKRTGDYIPPKGIKIDAKKGFIIDQKESKKIASTADKKQLAKTVALLNKDVKKQIIVVNKTENKPKAKASKSWGPKNHILTVQLKPYSEVLTVKNKVGNSEAEFYSDKATWLIFTWAHEWNDKWSSRLRIGGQDYEIDDKDVAVYTCEDFNTGPDECGREGEGGEFFSIGVGYKYSKKMTFLFDAVSRSEYYVVPRTGPSGGQGVEVIDNNVNSLDFGLMYSLKNWERFKMSTTGTLHLIGEEPVPGVYGGEEKASLSGLSLSGDLYYAWRKNLGVSVSLFWDRYKADADSIEYSRNAFGTGFDFVWDI